MDSGRVVDVYHLGVGLGDLAQSGHFANHKIYTQNLH
jgi:hypothetical protein